MKYIKKDLVIIILCYLLICIIFTLPLFLYLKTQIYAQAGDPFGTLYNFWWIKEHALNLDLANPPLFALSTKLGTIVFGEIITYNLFIIIGFVLTGFAGYLLIKKITGKNLAAFFSGLILALAPFRLAHSLQHLNFSDLSWLLFFIYFLLAAKENPNLKNIFLAGIFFVMTTLMNYQYGFMATMIFLIFLLVIIIEKIVNRSLLKTNKQIILPIILTLLFICLSIGYFIAPAVKDTLMFNKGDQTEVIPIRNKEELNVYSARWFNYVLPSPENPIVGKFTKSIYDQAITESGSNLTEMTLYLGWIPLLLMAYGIWYMIRYKIQNTKYKIQVLFFVILGLIGLYFSFAPTINIFGWQIKTPASFIFPHLPFFRVYARFGLLVMLSVSVLAGIGLAYLLEKIQSRRFALLLYCSIALLLLLEFLNFPPFRTIDVSEKTMPEVYKFLQSQPAGILVEYPLLPSEEPKSYDYLLWQRYHQMPLVYGAPMNSESDKFRKTILDPSNKETINELRSTGAKYLIIHRDRYTSENAKKYPIEYNNGKVPKIDSDQLDLIREFANEVVYKLK